MMKLLICLSLWCLISIQGLFFSVSKNPFCFEIEEDQGKTVKFFYEATAEEDKNIIVNFVEGPTGKHIQLTGQRNQTQFLGGQPTRVCFRSPNMKYKSVSIDFYPQDKSHLMQLALKSEIYQLHQKLLEVGDNLKSISRNQHFEQQRQIMHSNIIISHENTIKYFAAFKIMLIILISFSQLYLLRRMLDKRNKGYSPLQQS